MGTRSCATRLREGAAAIVSEEHAADGIAVAGVAGFACARRAKRSRSRAANFFGHPADALAARGGNRNERQNHDDFDHRFDRQGFRREDRSVRHDCVSHAGSATIRRQTPRPNRWTCRDFWRRFATRAGSYAVLEASSHSLAMDRLWGCHFAAAVFTNLTREHMDYHKTFRRLLRGEAEIVRRHRRGRAGSGGD